METAWRLAGIARINFRPAAQGCRQTKENANTAELVTGLHFSSSEGEKMHKYYSIAIAAMAAVGTLGAQDMQRRAMIGHGPGGGEGCSITVLVDGIADVEIRGDNATLRNVSGQAPQFREFECSRPIPPNADVRFTAEFGRGRQEMVRQGREGGAVVVHIEDSENGFGEYRFRLTWGEMGERREQGAMDRDRAADRGDNDYLQERERFFQGKEWRQYLFQRVREDVEHVEHSTTPFTGDRARLSRTVGELNELQEKLRKGRYDERQLSDVMAALRAVIDENRLTGHDRDALTDDLNRLRDFHERHDEYGARTQRD
jgi:hypothetical protein